MLPKVKKLLKLKKANIPTSYMNKEEFFEKIRMKYGFCHIDDFYATLGYGGSNATKFLTKFKELCKIDITEKADIKDIIPEHLIVKTASKSNHSGVIVEGVENCLVHISHCCSPVPGYVTRGRGVAVHRTDCINITNGNFSLEEQKRFIKVYWAQQSESNFQTMLCITAADRDSLLIDITTIAAEQKIPIKGLNARTTKNNIAIIEILIEVKNTEHLETTIKKLKNIKNVLSVVRRRQ